MLTVKATKHFVKGKTPRIETKNLSPTDEAGSKFEQSFDNRDKPQVAPHIVKEKEMISELEQFHKQFV